MMTVEQRTSKLIEALLIAQVSNVDPDDHDTILARWQFLIANAIRTAVQEINQRVEEDA